MRVCLDIFTFSQFELLFSQYFFFHILFSHVFLQFFFPFYQPFIRNIFFILYFLIISKLGQFPDSVLKIDLYIFTQIHLQTFFGIFIMALLFNFLSFLPNILSNCRPYIIFSSWTIFSTSKALQIFVSSFNSLVIFFAERFFSSSPKSMFQQA